MGEFFGRDLEGARSDLDRLGNRETPAVLNLLVIEDLAMAVYLPVVAAVVVGRR